LERGARRGVSKQGSSTPGAVEEASSRAAVLLLHHRPFFQGTPVSKQQALEYTPATSAHLVVSSRVVISITGTSTADSSILSKHIITHAVL
jgi:hypothetical protein